MVAFSLTLDLLFLLLTSFIVCHAIRDCLSYRAIGIIVSVFADGTGDRGSVPGRVIPKTQKIVLGASLHNTQHYKIRIKSKRSSPGNEVAPSPHFCVVAIEKGAFRSPSISVSQLTLTVYVRITYIYIYIYEFVRGCMGGCNSVAG